MQALGDDDKANIEQTIDDEVLQRHGDRVPLDRGRGAPDGNTLHVQGELTLVGVTRPDRVRRRRSATDGELTGSAVVKQSDWGIKPYSALFGALKVADEVEIEVDASEERSLAEVRRGRDRHAAPRSSIPGISSFLLGAPLRPLLVVRDGRDRDLVGRIVRPGVRRRRSSSSCSSAPAAVGLEDQSR